MAQELAPGKVAFIFTDPLAEAFFQDLATLIEKKESYKVDDKTSLQQWKVEFPNGKIRERLIYGEN